jgi:hypothetical protein
MVVVDGLQVQLELVDRNNLNWQNLEEYESVTCIHRTSGLSVHRAVCLPLGERFQISLKVDKTCFEWANANALRLRINFDNRSEIKDVAVVMARPSLANTINARILSVTASVNEYVQLRDLARPIKPTITSRNGTHEMFDEEVVSFTTVPMQSQGRRQTPKREGTITIAVDRCQLSARPRGLAAVSPPEYDHTEKASEHSLRDAGIHSEVKLFDRTLQFSISPNYRLLAIDTVGIFHFHYRVQEAFDEFKASDQARYRVEAIEDGKHRIHDATPKPEDTGLNIEGHEGPNRGEAMVADDHQPLHSHETQVDDDGDTVVVATDRPTDIAETNADEPSSPHSMDYDAAGDTTMAKIGKDAGAEARALKAPASDNELEFVLDREQAVLEEIKQNQVLQVQAYNDVIKALNGERRTGWLEIQRLQKIQEEKEKEIEELNKMRDALETAIEEQDRTIESLRDKEIKGAEARLADLKEKQDKQERILAKVKARAAEHDGGR